jgi:hypothetical protein
MQLCEASTRPRPSSVGVDMSGYTVEGILRELSPAPADAALYVVIDALRATPLGGVIGIGRSSWYLYCREGRCGDRARDVWDALRAYRAMTGGLPPGLPEFLALTGGEESPTAPTFDA